MQEDRRERALEIARRAGAEALLAAHPGTVTSLTGFAADIELGYPHHTGHGLGVSWHEEPRIVPDSDTILEPGMIVALEPAV